MNWVLGLLAGLGGLGGLAALVRALIDRPKVRADAVATITNAASTQILSLSQRLAIVEQRLDDTRTQLDATDKKAGRAELQVSRLAWYQQSAAGWHQRHAPFDTVMQKILRQIRPEMLSEPALLDEVPGLEPFPYWEEGPAA